MTHLNRITQIVFAVALFLSMTIISNAQDVLVGLTSNGGEQGGGTAFSMKNNGSNFSIIKGFANWGMTPNGDLYKDADGNFYGMTNTGGTYGSGTIFKMTSSGAITILRHLNSVTDGATPNGELIKGTDGNLYGMTTTGGTNGYGTIFKITTTGTFTVLKHLSIITDGSNPRGHLVQATDGNFYGITYGGGANFAGTIFKITPSGTFTVLRSLAPSTDGGNSYSSLTLGSDGNLYGSTYSGGTNTFGTIFKITTSGTFTVLRNLSSATDGANSQSDLLLGSDGNFYGTCSGGGSHGNGTIFKITPGGTYTVLRHLTSSTDGGIPYGNLFQDSNNMMYGMNRTGGTNTNGTAYKISSSGNFTLLHSFVSATEGSTPNGGFVKGSDGNLYGMTSYGGTFTGGTIFKMTTTGTVTVLANFNGATLGNTPYESLVQGTDNAYYGTTSKGGTYGYGTIFKICGGATNVLYSFNKTADGGTPKGSLIQATDGNFYGTASEGGTNNAGTIFKITPNGGYTVIRHLSASTDGGTPLGSLVQGTDGLLYGMTSGGGTNAGGTIFKMATNGTSFTVLRHLSFTNDGSVSEGNLIQATDGNFYGMTNSNARIFKITSTGTFTVLRTLASTADGTNPAGSLVQASDGNLYGMNSTGGSFGSGTIFKITTAGTYTVLKHLNSTVDGKTPKGSLVIGTDGNFYGMTSAGGTNNYGTIFKITSSGTYTILRHFTIATDGGTPYGSLILAPVNNLVANPLTITTDEDVKAVFTMSGSGGNPLTFSVVTNPSKGTITSDIKYKPNANYAGADSFFYVATVGCLSSAPAKVSVTVTPIADAPVLNNIGNKTGTVGTLLSFTATATDADAGQALTYSLITPPSGATINASTGKFKWTPSTSGSFTFKVRVTDNDNPPLFDEEQITVTVTGFAHREIETNEESASIQETIYPNPVQSIFSITLHQQADEAMVTIIDGNGRMISSNIYDVAGKNNIEVNGSDLKSGFYFVQLQIGDQMQTLKFVKD